VQRPAQCIDLPAVVKLALPLDSPVLEMYDAGTEQGGIMSGKKSENTVATVDEVAIRLR
jgi:hypothetical protein